MDDSAKGNAAESKDDRSWSIFDVPPPLKRIFDHFPLQTYPVDELPQRVPRGRTDHVLHVFTTENDAAHNRPSFNPQCLKYQTYLRFAGIRFRTVVSSNHASPTGVLPFVQPGSSNPDCLSPSQPIPSNKLRKWIEVAGSSEQLKEEDDVRYDAYTSLLEGRIRTLWLCQLYLVAPNAPLVRRLYVNPCSSQPFVRTAIAQQLQAAAETEVIKARQKNAVSLLDVSRDAEEAFLAFSSLLGDDSWFFGNDRPGMFDASVFAYTHLLLDENLGWVHNPAGEIVKRHENLARHRDRILDMYF